MNFYVWKEEREHGPFSEAELRARCDSGAFSPQDFARREVDTEWTALGEFLAVPGAPAAPAQTPAPAKKPMAGPEQRRKLAAAFVAGLLALLLGVGWAYHSFVHVAPSGMSDDTGSTPANSSPAASTSSSGGWFSSLTNLAGGGSSDDEGELNPAVPSNMSPRATEILRYLHTQGGAKGATDGQLAVAAVAIDNVITKYNVDQITLQACETGTDTATRMFDFSSLRSIGMPDGSDGGVHLREYIDPCLPPRFLFDWDPRDRLTLPPRKWKGPQPGAAKPGVLSQELLTSFRGAYFDLWNHEHPEYEQGRTAYGDELKLIPPLSEDLKVLEAVYDEGDGGERRYAFWYQKQPDGLEDAVKKVDSKDVIFKFGAPVSEAPMNEPQIMLQMAEEAGAAHRPQAPMAAPTEFSGSADQVNTGTPVPRGMVLINEAAILTGQTAMSVEVDMHGVQMEDSDERDKMVTALTNAGIKILPETEGTYPKLVLKFDAAKGLAIVRNGTQEYLTLSGDLSFRCLYPNNVKGRSEKFIEAIIWHKGVYGITTSWDDVSNDIDSLTNQFLDDYKEANGK